MRSLGRHSSQAEGLTMHSLIYIVGFIVVVVAVLSFLGLS